MTTVIVPKVPADPDKIRRVIRQAGILQSVVAREAGIQKPTLSRQLSGQRPINLEELIAIARVLRVEWRSLLVDACADCGGVHCAKGHDEDAAEDVAA